jgi:hypothetical protein
MLLLLCASTRAQGEIIRVKFLDGRTGHPVTYEGAELWVSTATRSLVAPAHNKEGTARFIVIGDTIRAVWPGNGEGRQELPIRPGLATVAAGPEVYAEACGRMGFPPYGPWCPISEILRRGAVSESHCGKARAKAKPGELILFIKPLSFWRRLLDGFRS